MKVLRVVRGFSNTSHVNKYIKNFTRLIPANLNRTHCHLEKTFNYKCRQYSTEHEDESDDIPFVENEALDQLERHKDYLFSDSDDEVIKQLKECSSLNGVWSVLSKYKGKITENRITQSFLVLKDIQNMHCKLNYSIITARNDFLKELKNSPDFHHLINLVTKNLNNFNPELLCYIFLCLHKLGMHSDDYPMMIIAEELQRYLLKNYNISMCSKWMKVIFKETGVRPYYMSMDLIPKIFQSLDECESVKDLANVSTCLTKLQNIVNADMLTKYVHTVEKFLDQRKINGFDCNSILKIITFLSLPEWKDEYVPLTSKCIALLKNNINRFDVPHVLILYEIFFKIQEPGELLTEIQRNTAKFWQQYEESDDIDLHTKLKLFSALIYFNSPSHKINLRNHIHKIFKDKMSTANLILVRKIFSYLKTSDQNLCQQYWRSWSNVLREDSSIYLLVKACQNYILFNTDLNNYRNYTFEKQVLEITKDSVNRGELIFASDLVALLSFVLLYSKDERLLNILIKKLQDNPLQLKGKDHLMLSKVLDQQRNYCSEKHYTMLKNILNEASQLLLLMNDSPLDTNIFLIKSAICFKEYDNLQTNCLMTELKNMKCMSSKILQNVSYIFLSTNTLIPEIFNKISEYILNNRNNIVGFNAEKILFLCFHLAYIPINADKFFRAVTDIIIRDQERLSGLAFLQSALSLSFFHKLPSFLVKQIFNVEFMDKLESELANCYSKDIYPQRVRQTLMYLNRVVCLEYPEFNVPWFHKQYIKDNRKLINVNETTDYTIAKSIKEYLVEIAGNNILENVIAPYGYHLDFVLNLNKNNIIVPQNSQEINKRVALLLVRQYAFTRFYVHLRGTYQMKIRHLEILGYSVSLLKCDEWINLLYSEERIEYLRKLIWPEPLKIDICTNN